MLQFRLAAVLAVALLAPAASWAVPTVTNPNFNVPVSEPAIPNMSYGISGWGATGLPAGDPNYNPSYAGNIGQDGSSQWNNGTPGNGQTAVGFLSADGSYIFQTIGGFTPGDLYQVSLLVNARILDAANPNSQPAGLTVQVGGNTVLSQQILPVGAYNTYLAAFTQETAMFVAASITETVRLTNSGADASTLLLSGFALADVGPANLPEPMSLALFGTGLAALSLVRRRH